MNEHARWQAERRVELAAKALEEHGFTVWVCRNREEAAERLVAEAADARTVGFGGSITLVELGMPERMAALGKECLIHGAPGLSPEERVEIMRRQLTCDLFLSGANAITLDGCIVNVDATGNRVGAVAFGPKKVRVVAGANKIVDSVEAARARIREWAAPPNAHRLSFKTPCATTGRCVDCRSPDRICRIVQILERRPRLTDLGVLLVPEPLGL
ncbi:MAG: lactate utilization protein [Candidatus Dadabacteria bacterium]|nr:MAG: lactate utilization protein [Candidatus Dadabacteria bacterium]